MSGFVKNLVRAFNAGAASSLTSSALGVAMTPGNGIIAAVKTSNGVTVTSFTDTQGNVYTLDCQSPAAASGRGASLFSCLAPIAPLGATDTCTANLSGSSSGTSICLAEYAGLVARDQVGRNDSGAGAGTSGTVTLAGPTSLADEIEIVALAWSGAVTAISPTAPLVLRNGATNLTSGVGALCDRVLSAIGTPTETFSWTTSAAYAAAVATYTLSGGAAPDATLGMIQPIVHTGRFRR